LPASGGFCIVCGDGERDLRLVRADLNSWNDVFVIPNTNTSELGVRSEYVELRKTLSSFYKRYTASVGRKCLLELEHKRTIIISNLTLKFLPSPRIRNNNNT
jgi:hypothetical protein